MAPVFIYWASPTQATVIMADISHWLYIDKHPRNKTKLRKCPIPVQICRINLHTYSSLLQLFAHQLYWLTARIHYKLTKWTLSLFTEQPQQMRPWLWSWSVTDFILISSVWIRTSYESAPCKLQKCHIGLPTYSSLVFVSSSLTSCIDSHLELITSSPNGPCLHSLDLPNTCDRYCGRHQ